MTLNRSSGSHLKPIETQYKGYRFRSRLEARWAVFFDTLKVKWIYEPEGFDLGNGIYYLPDFWLPDYKTWIEIKPIKPEEEEMQKAFLLSHQSKNPVIIQSGYPDAYILIDEMPDLYMWSEDCTMQMYLGQSWEMWYPNYLTEGAMWVLNVSFYEHSLPEFLKDKYPDREIPDHGQTEQNRKKLVKIDQEYYQNKYHKPHPKWQFGRRLKGRWEYKSRLKFDFDGLNTINFYVKQAIDAAKAARFEHGETP